MKILTTTTLTIRDCEKVETLLVEAGKVIKSIMYRYQYENIGYVVTARLNETDKPEEIQAPLGNHYGYTYYIADRGQYFKMKGKRKGLHTIGLFERLTQYAAYLREENKITRVRYAVKDGVIYILERLYDREISFKYPTFREFEAAGLTSENPITDLEVMDDGIKIAILSNGQVFGFRQ